LQQAYPGAKKGENLFEFSEKRFKEARPQRRVSGLCFQKTERQGFCFFESEGAGKEGRRKGERKGRGD
jgi:hypothetical protein